MTLTLNESSAMWYFKCGNRIEKHNRIFSFYTGLLQHINIACAICIVLSVVLFVWNYFLFVSVSSFCLPSMTYHLFPLSLSSLLPGTGGMADLRA